MKLILALVFLAISSSVFFGKKFQFDRLIVKTSNESVLKKPTDKKLQKSLDYYVVFSENFVKLKKELEQNKSVSYVSFDYKSSTSSLPNTEKIEFNKNDSQDSSVFNDPYIRTQYALYDFEKHGMSVVRTFNNRRSSPEKEVIVAVVDTGVDYTHQDLPMWTNENEIPSNGIDDDGNGYIDDIHGINTLVRDENGNATMEVMDAHNHGTHVSGSIAAIQNNGIGIAGIASKAKIMAIRTVPNRSDETDVDVTEAFIYAAKNGAKIINCSFGKSVNERDDGEGCN